MQNHRLGFLRSAVGALALRHYHAAREIASVFASTPRVFTLVWEVGRGRVIALCCMALAQGLVPLGRAWLLKAIVDEVVAAARGDGRGVVGRLIGLAVAQFALSVSETFIGVARSHVQQVLTDAVAHQVRLRVLRKSTSLELVFFETPCFYDRLRTVQQLGTEPVHLVAGGVLELGRNAIVLISMLGLLWSFHPLLVLAIAFAAVPQLVAQVHYGRSSWKLAHRQAPLSRQESYLASVMTDKVHAKEVRMHALGAYLLARYSEVALRLIRQSWEFHKRQRLLSSALALLGHATSSAAYLYVLLQAAGQRITLGDLTLYGAAVVQAQGTLVSFLAGLGSVYQTNLRVGDLFQFLDLRVGRASERPARKVPCPLRQGLEFVNVSFSYPVITP